MSISPSSMPPLRLVEAFDEDNEFAEESGYNMKIH